jgi:hypothetical protein
MKYLAVVFVTLSLLFSFKTVNLLHVFVSNQSYNKYLSYEGVSKGVWTGLLEQKLQMVQLSGSAVVSLFCESV